MTSAPIISSQNLTVRYGPFVALDSVSLAIPPGCVGLLGPNGAGKTTLIKTLLGFVKPASGTAQVLGEDASRPNAALRQLVGLMPEQDCHLPEMSAVEYVAYAGELAGMPSNEALRRAHEVLEYVGLGEARYRKVETFSTGMKQRSKLAQALVHGPKVLLLDEPTNGLDPRGRTDMLNLVRKISADRAINVIVCSHLLKDIERTCDSVVVLMRGRVISQSRVTDLVHLEGDMVDVELREHNDAFLTDLTHQGYQVFYGERTNYRVKGTKPGDKVGQMLFRTALRTGAEIRGFTRSRRTLEEAILELMQQS